MSAGLGGAILFLLGGALVSRATGLLRDTVIARSSPTPTAAGPAA